MMKLAIAEGSREVGSRQPATMIYCVSSPSTPVFRPHRTPLITCAAPSRQAAAARARRACW